MATSKRGFGAMAPEQRKMIARKGGQAAHAKGAAHEFTSQEAREAGRKGGQSVSRNRDHMVMIGRMGGLKTPAYSQRAGGPMKDTYQQASHNGDEWVKPYVQEETQRFPETKQKLGGDDLEHLSAQIQERKQSLTTSS
jgi:general stress protein YciG